MWEGSLLTGVFHTRSNIQYPCQDNSNNSSLSDSYFPPFRWQNWSLLLRTQVCIFRNTPSCGKERAGLSGSESKFSSQHLSFTEGLGAGEPLPRGRHYKTGLSPPWTCEDFMWSFFSKHSWLTHPFSNVLGKVLDPISCPYGAWGMFVAKGEITQFASWSDFKRTGLPSKSPVYPWVSHAHFSGFAMQNEQCFSCGD